MRLAAIVISYKIKNEVLFNNIQGYFKEVEKLIIWDNTPSSEKLIDFSYWEKYNNVILMGTGKNEGIGYALNKAVGYLKNNGYTHVMLMDQDSIWKDFNIYKNIFCNDKTKDVALYAPTIADANSNFVFSCNKSDLYAITSGSVLCLEHFSKIGGFNESFFIDEVDNDFCIRARKLNYHIQVFPNVFLYQNFGDGGSYSEFRLYHQSRNRIWMTRMHFRFLPLNYHLRTISHIVILRIFSILRNENNKANKIKYILKGIWHGLSQSPGK